MTDDDGVKDSEETMNANSTANNTAIPVTTSETQPSAVYIADKEIEGVTDKVIAFVD